MKQIFLLETSAGDSNLAFDYVLLHYENLSSVKLIFHSTDFQFNVVWAYWTWYEDC